MAVQYLHCKPAADIQKSLIITSRDRGSFSTFYLMDNIKSLEWGTQRRRGSSQIFHTYLAKSVLIF